MQFFEENVSFTSFLLIMTLNSVTANDETISEESEIVYSSYENNIKDDNITETNGGSVGYTNSSSISAERPIEDYINDGRLKVARGYSENWWDRCYRKIDAFCLKQCNRALKDACKAYGCRTHVTYMVIRRLCREKCKSKRGPVLIIITKGEANSSKR
ncbi:hypothetical protein evm_010385 [Chilo suppressalis]|nr:hypothetical protein evm_010385 [Chilo suppressalis]